jgi:two-component system OmpR family response regulator
MQNEAARILVVDDEESITQLVSTVLRYEGFEVECAAGGRAAVKLTDRFRPDLIVLDVMLPDLDGFEVYRRLSATEPRVPVLFLTAKDQPADRVHGLTLGADDYVGKPFSLEELVARVRAILRRTQPARPPGRRRGSPTTTSRSTTTRTRCAAASGWCS